MMETMLYWATYIAQALLLAVIATTVMVLVALAWGEARAFHARGMARVRRYEANHANPVMASVTPVRNVSKGAQAHARVIEFPSNVVMLHKFSDVS